MTSRLLSDQDLLLNIKYDDEQAFNELFERHWSRVYTVSYRYVKDEELAMEITHDVFVNIWKKRADLNITSFKSYVVAAGSYHSMRKIREQKNILLTYIEDFQEEPDASLYSLSATYNDGEYKLRAEELDKQVKLSLEELPKRCREIYLMSRVENLSIAEIAERLNISKRTVENQITIALKHLKAVLRCAVLMGLFF